MKAASLRARVRAEMTEEIKTVAKRHLAEEGANLSLRAVARDIGMASSAVYRYFASRDELLTALIIDAYDSLGAAAESAAAGGDAFARRWIDTGHAVREWALARPHEWALIYGSPVPGYAAPRDTVTSAIRVILALGGIVAEAHAAGALPDGEPLAEPLAPEARSVADVLAPGLPPQVAFRALGGWLQLCGAISAELFGQLQNTVEARREFLEFQMRGTLAWIGLEVTP
ncbi:TetR/AcrR family transcriptional regulator [Actinoplanes sp. NBRC 103695]|uniref:TetR/AcrR family transcriptional regulator n=1 Tax=Actinoplanes sp. NBRC 103695 TaxID=3032202 RepID=UPI0024A23C5B|nr:TetR/AcrR family transcriptional regulator [Actinoplanes sp. NBRC 103695]GLY93877.1 TetR family transcriptional regulator [Actinoplanes sp. NBRC 103695]